MDISNLVFPKPWVTTHQWIMIWLIASPDIETDKLIADKENVLNPMESVTEAAILCMTNQLSMDRIAA